MARTGLRTSLMTLGLSAAMLVAAHAGAQNGPGAPQPPRPAAGAAAQPQPGAPGGAAATQPGAPGTQQPPNAAPSQPGGPPAQGGSPGAPPAPGAAQGLFPAAGPPGAQPQPGFPQPPGPMGTPGAFVGPQQGPPGMDGSTYAVRLRDLEQRIDELKEQIRRSHTRLSLLSDTVLSGGGAGSRAVIKFTNDLSNAFRVTRVLVVLDGAVQYNKTDQSGALAEQTEIPIFNGSVPPGDHTLQVLINLQGHGYGAFSYLRAYRFEVRSSHSFTAVEGKTVTLQALAHEKGGVTTPLEERPAIRYSEKVSSGLADAAPK